MVTKAAPARGGAAGSTIPLPPKPHLPPKRLLPPLPKLPF